LDLTAYVEAVIAGGASMSSQALLAGVSVMTIRARVKRDPRYEAAKRGGMLICKDRMTAEELRAAPDVMAVIDGGMTVAQAAKRFDLSDVGLRARIRRAYPDRFTHYARFRAPEAAASV
jgi:transposase